MMIQSHVHNFPLTKSLSSSSLILKQPTYYDVPFIQFCYSASMLCAKSFSSVWYFWHSLWWHHMREIGHMKQVFMQAHYFHLSAFCHRNKMNRQIRFPEDEKFAVLLTSTYLSALSGILWSPHEHSFLNYRWIDHCFLMLLSTVTVISGQILSKHWLMVEALHLKNIDHFHWL